MVSGNFICSISCFIVIIIRIFFQIYNMWDEMYFIFFTSSAIMRLINSGYLAISQIDFWYEIHPL